MNNCYFRWRKNCNENKVKEKIVCLDKVFSNIQNAFGNSFSVFSETKLESQNKMNAINRLFRNNVKKLQSYLNTWRVVTKKIKLGLL